MATFGSAQDCESTYVNTETSTVQTGRTRVYGVYLDSGSAAGDFHLRDGSSSGTIKFKCKTPANAEGITITFPAPILCKNGGYVNFTTEHVVAATGFHSGGNNN